MTTMAAPAAARRDLSEKEFLRQVVDLAKILGYEAYHPWLSIHSPRGWPDLALVRPPRLILAELKREKGKLTEPQEKWQRLLLACPGIECYVWRPSDLEAIADILREAPARTTIDQALLETIGGNEP